MTLRHNHYEAAFEAMLRSRRLSHVAVDEVHRSPVGPEITGEEGRGSVAERTLKSLDFILSPGLSRSGWLIDVKGRRFPSGRRRQLWRNWSTGDELQSLSCWEEQFGDRFRGLLVFAYLVNDDVSPLPPEQLFRFRESRYAFLGVTLGDYLTWCRRISPKWNTFAVAAKEFRLLAKPFDCWVRDDPGQARASAGNGNGILNNGTAPTPPLLHLRGKVAEGRMRGRPANSP